MKTFIAEKMSRYMSVLLIIAVAMSVCPWVAFGEYSQQEVLLNANFNTNPQLSFSDNLGSFKISTITDGVSTESGNLVLSPDAAIILKANESINYNIVVDFRFKYTENINGAYLMSMMDSKYNYGPVLTLSNGKIASVKNNEITEYDAICTSGRYYNVKVVVNLSSCMYDVYVNTAKYAQDIEFDCNIEEILYPFAADNMGGEGRVLYDEIKIYKEYPGRFSITSDDFSNYESEYTPTVNIEGQTIAGLELYSSSAYPSGVKVSDGKLCFGDGENATKFFAKMPSGKEIATPFVTEFDFCRTKANGNINTIYRCTDANASLWGIDIAEKGGDLYTRDAGTEVKILSGCETDRVYNFRIYADPIAKTFSVYIDDKCVANQFGLQDSFVSFGRFFNVNMNADTSEFYIDNFNMYTDIRETELFNAGKKLKLLGGVINSDFISLPCSETSGYEIVWLSSDENIVDTATGEVNQSRTKNQRVTLTATVKDDAALAQTSVKFDFTVNRLVEEGVTIIAADDFDNVSSLSVGSSVGDGKLKVVSSNGATVTTFDDGNKAIKVSFEDSPRDDFANLYMDYNSDVDNSAYTIEFSFMLEDKGNNYAIFSAAGQVGSGLLNAVRIFSDSDNIYALSGAEEESPQNLIVIENYEADRWYDLKLYVDETSQTYDVYYNGICTVQGAAFCPEVGQTLPSHITRPLMLRTNRTDQGLYYIDNIFYYKTE